MEGNGIVDKSRNDSKTSVYSISEKSQIDSSVQSFQSKDPICLVSVSDSLPDQNEKVVEHPTTYLETLMHLFKGNVGSGIFAMGDAFHNAGIIFGSIFTCLLGVICVHCQHLLLSASQEMMRRTSRVTAPDFAETVELCFATGPLGLRKMSTFMRRLVNLFLCVTQFGFCCVYFVFIASNLQYVADQYSFHLKTGVWMAIILTPILLPSLIRNLKFLAPVSIAANVFMISGVAITLYFTTQDLNPISSVDYIAKPQMLPLYFGTAIFAFEGIGLILPLRNEMKKPKQFGTTFGVLNTGMSIVTVLLVLVGFLSYLKYGDCVQGSVTLNFPKDNILAQAVEIMISCGILLGYAIQFYIPIDILWPSITEKFGPFKYPVFGELCFRSAWVFVTFALAEAIPFLDLFISLVGAVSSTALMLIFPPILELVIHGQLSEKKWWVFVKNGLILTIGVLGMVTGTYESIRAIVAAYSNETDSTCTSYNASIYGGTSLSSSGLSL